MSYVCSVKTSLVSLWGVLNLATTLGLHFIRGNQKEANPSQTSSRLRTKIAKSIGCGETPYLALLFNGNAPMDREFCMVFQRSCPRNGQSHAYSCAAVATHKRHGPARGLGEALGKWGFAVMSTRHNLRCEMAIRCTCSMMSALRRPFSCERIARKRKRIDVTSLDVSHQQAMTRKLGDTAAGAIRVHINGVACAQDCLAEFLVE